ncbi:Tfp pilus assembly protein FimT/FimU [Lysobacter sp.]|uniref:GspH/FimT family pseudopilin n=1 Tax=Lysobacter sp. TaxID=72226 RepID=UPI002D62B15B|nr:Tfp pilus assembly protein FimT/FimU [Lysobacter sp.]HZX76296.1 Tfp pilus assembly protein FimT/FimU [Lysobacter sp.]
MHRLRRGFTLVELVTTLTVLSVLLALGVPAFSQLMESARVSGIFHELTGSLASARMVAISQRAPISVCPSQDGRNCRRDLSWDDGWIVFVDTNRSAKPAREEDVLRQLGPVPQDIAIRATAGRHYLRYQPSGFGYGTNLTLRLCSRRTGYELGAVVVNNAGRVRSERPLKPLKCAYSP